MMMEIKMKQQIVYNENQVLSYVEYGNNKGFPLLIQHGLIASIDDFDLFQTLIQHDFRVICIARPGYGDSSPFLMSSFAQWADIVYVLINELQIDKFNILGMSSGAPYSYALGSRFKERTNCIYIFSGIPALYDKDVISKWPYDISKNGNIEEMKILSKKIFFSNLSKDDLKRNEIRDSMKNDCFGVAQDLRLRSLNWGFSLDDIKSPVIMRQSKTDNDVPYETALRTSKLLKNCKFVSEESGPHFSEESLNNFIAEYLIK
jgi:pimeloyl-ACP methyl ester carboxylesterase